MAFNQSQFDPSGTFATHLLGVPVGQSNWYIGALPNVFLDPCTVECVRLQNMSHMMVLSIDPLAFQFNTLELNRLHGYMRSAEIVAKWLTVSIWKTVSTCNCTSSTF